MWPGGRMTSDVALGDAEFESWYCHPPYPYPVSKCGLVVEMWPGGPELTNLSSGTESALYPYLCSICKAHSVMWPGGRMTSDVALGDVPGFAT
ncbi:hypothetical protein CEXT_631311 [Caerostris extrusa]|uniref:Uncharacterized protein n=1 Tax=Caerostris extrusa TaxID=172846 RepID=A0AAV4N672_CAEEX|nr:hypothetical protein CEXT_631311 [Caerostris extrusa]